MSRVAQLDSIALDKELYGQFWSEFNAAFNTSEHKEEWELALNTVVFMCATRFLPHYGSSCTYGSIRTQWRGFSVQETHLVCRHCLGRVRVEEDHTYYF